MESKSRKFTTLFGVTAFLAAGAVFACGGCEEGGNFTGRMTGGGSIQCGSLRVTHGFELHCGTGSGGSDIPTPNNLEINWDGNQFHLIALESSVCTNDPLISEGHPNAGFDTLTGSGIGRYDQEPGYAISFVLTDAGEPGTYDQMGFIVTSPEGATVLSCPLTTLTGGNHQAHRLTGNP